MVKLNECWSLKNEESIKKALEYAEDAESLKVIIEKIEITATFKGLKKWNDTDKKEHMIFNIEIIRGEKKINFEFNQSINFSEIFAKGKNDIRLEGEYFQNKFYNRAKLVNILDIKQKEAKNDFLYSVLCCIKSDSYIPNNFTDFCSEFGYNEDSMKDFNLFNKCLEQKNKIFKIFSESELEIFPS